MILYHLHDWQRAALAPFRIAAEATQAAFKNPFLPFTNTQFGRTIAAGAEMFERVTRNFGKPAFGLNKVKLGRNEYAKVEEEVIMTKPFCRLLHFKRQVESKDPKMLVVAPMSGHHATLLRGTVEDLMPDHDVYITDWIDAKMVPLALGKFDLEDYITYVMEFIRKLGPDVHILAICQPAPPVFAAIALMAQMDDPAQPRSMTLMGGPIDTRTAKTVVTELGVKKPMDWFRNTVIHAIPFYYPGAYRLVYPGFIQLNGFISMNADRHVGEHVKMFQHLIKGDDDFAHKHREFYDEYLSVMDVTAEFYLQTIERVFKNHDLPEGRFMWHGKTVDPSAIRKTALLVVEGELDDISAPGQTKPAMDMCSNLPDHMKRAHLQIGVGHFGIFHGRKWRESVLPVLREFVRKHNEAPSEDHAEHSKHKHKKPHGEVLA